MIYNWVEAKQHLILLKQRDGCMNMLLRLDRQQPNSVNVN